MNTLKELFEKIDNAKELDFGTIFSDSIELFKKTWVQGLLLQLFTLIIMLPIIIIFYIPLIGLMITQQENGGYYDPELYNTFFTSMSLLYVFVLVVGVVLLSTLSVALNLGFFRIMKKLDHNEQVLSKDFFYFFKANHLANILALILIMVIIAIPSALLCYIPLIYVMVPLSFVTVIYAFNEDLSVLDVIKASFKIGNKKWLLTFGLLIVIYLCVVFLTIITCGIGSLFLNSLMYHPIYLVYKKVVGFDEKVDTAQEQTE